TSMTQSGGRYAPTRRENPSVRAPLYGKTAPRAETLTRIDSYSLFGCWLPETASQYRFALPMHSGATFGEGRRGGFLRGKPPRRPSPKVAPLCMGNANLYWEAVSGSQHPKSEYESILVSVSARGAVLP